MMIRRNQRPQRGEDGGGIDVPMATAVPTSANRTEKHRRRRTPKQKKKKMSSIISFVILIVVLLNIGFFLSLGGIKIPNYGGQPLPVLHPRVAEHMALYRKIREKTLARSTPEMSWPLTYMNQEDHLGNNVLLADYAAHVAACEITVIFLDPRLADPHYGAGESAWFALESAAAFAPSDACFALLTHGCAMRDFLRQSSSASVSVDTAVRDKVYASSLPLFRERIQAGRVRLSYVDYEQYHLKACDDFGNPTSALVNVNFWSDEFVDKDSDAVLLLQDDSVLCRSMENLTEYAFVGAVWPRTPTKLMPNPSTGMCWGMSSLYKLLTLHMKPDDYARLGISPSFPNPCDTLGNAPIGNGGLSFRSRKWMQRAITTCPHVSWSGLGDKAWESPCRALDEVNEDYYFGTVLNGLQAPLPSAKVASLFAVESLFPEQVLSLYGTSQQDEHKEFVTEVIQAEQEFLSVPVGFHKPWWYHSNEWLLSPAMRNACPLLPFVFLPEMSRWERPQDGEG